MLFECELGRFKHVAYVPKSPTCSRGHPNYLMRQVCNRVGSLARLCRSTETGTPLHVGSCVGEQSRYFAMSIKYQKR